MEAGIDDILDCPLCYMKLSDPVSLDCGHTFCKDCILDLQATAKKFKHKHFNCTICMRKYKFRTSENWSVCLPVKQLIEFLTDYKAKKRKIETDYEVDFDAFPEEILNSL